VSQVRHEASWPQRLLLAVAQGRLDWATGGRVLGCASGAWAWASPLASARGAARVPVDQPRVARTAEAL